MARSVQGPLYYERMGRGGTVIAFLHPNPMDQSCWLYQLAHFSTWYRCIAIDLPGYGRSPHADRGLTLSDMAEACWEAVDDAFPDEPAIIVGCSAGSLIAPQMYHTYPSRTLALVLSGTGYGPERAKAERRAMRIQGYQQQGITYRWQYTFEDFSPAFRATPLAHYFATLFSERDSFADVQSIIYQFEAIGERKAESFYSGVRCPTIVLTGSEDNAHKGAFRLKEQLPVSEVKVLPGAGHACHLEQPWLFDRFVIEFLARHGLFPKELGRVET